MLFFCLLGAGSATASPVTVLPDGEWLIEGYNYIVKVEGRRWQQYAKTSISCKLVREEYGPFPYSVLAVLSDKKVKLQSGISEYTAQSTHLPERCLDSVAMNSQDPLFNFDVFWNYFNENYAHFSTRNVDWSRVYDTERKKIADGKALWPTLEAIVHSIGDGHVTLVDDSSSPPRIAEGDNAAASMLAAYLKDEFGSNDLNTFEKRYLHYKNRLFEEVYNNKLSRAWSLGNGRIWGGELTPSVAYVTINYMFGFAEQGQWKILLDYWISTIKYRLGFSGAPKNVALEKEKVALALLLDQLVNKVEKYDALIIDVRMNPGGYDSLSLQIASRFADTKRLAFSKKARFMDSFTPEQPVYVSPADEQGYTKPVYVLVSERTGSAAEIFTLAMRVMPHVTIVGENTAGGLSDAHEFIMPNGWAITLSNEVYTAADGVLYEGKGVPPQIRLPSFEKGRLVESFVDMTDRLISEVAGDRSAYSH